MKGSNWFVVRLLALAFTTTLLSITAQAATLGEGPGHSPSTAGRAAADSHREAERLGISYVLYDDAITLLPVSEAEAPVPMGCVEESREPALPGAAMRFAVSTVPMTAGEKFMLFVTKSFKPPGPYAFSAFTGTFNELLDSEKGRDSSVGDFFADAATRAARSFAFRISANFFEKFAYPIVFRQDPRYHRSNKTSVGGKIGYAISRLFVTQGDRGGDQFNASYIIGGLSAAAVSNAWERKERQTVGDSLKRFGIHVGLTAFTNIVREFIGGQ